MDHALDHRCWHRRWWGDLALRLCGGVLLALAWLAGSGLQARADRHVALGLIDGALAAAAFLAVSAGSTSLLGGGHLFDAVPIRQRWLRAPGRQSDRRSTGSISR